MEIMSASIDTEQLALRLQTLRRRVRELYQRGGPAFQRPLLLSEAFAELEHALEQIEMAHAALQQQNECWLDQRAQLYTEMHEYRILFEQAPSGYLISGPDGSIRQVNDTALELFQADERLMIGRSLALFVPDGQRRTFRDEIAALRECQGIQTWQRELQTWQGEPFPARLTVAVVRGKKGRPTALRWLVQDCRWQAQIVFDEMLHERAVGSAD
jgi:PAS domain S-box-containing protein